MIPTWWQAVLLALAAFRLTRLGSYDDLTLSLRRWVTGMGDEEHHQWAHVIETLAQHGEAAWRPQYRYRKLDEFERHWVTLTGEGALPRLVSAAAQWKRAGRPTDRTGYYLAPTPPVPHWRFYLGKLIRCPWCLSAYVVVVGWGLWLAWPHAILVVSVPLALMAVVGLIAKNMDA